MIVPFVYSIKDLISENPEHMWIFYKYLYFCEQYNYPIIATDIYFNEYKNVVNEEVYNNFLFKKVNNEFKDKMKKYSIDSSLKKSKLNKENLFDLECADLTTIDLDLEIKIEQIINKIKKDYGSTEKIILITWKTCATLDKVAKKQGIKVIYQEVSTIRNGQYNDTLCYFSFNPKYNDDQRKNYQKFLSSSDKLKILTPMEILSLFLPDEKMLILKELKKIPKYLIGFCPMPNKDVLSNTYKNEEESITIANIKEKYDDKNVSYRCHPNYKTDIDLGEWSLDHNKYSYEWILENCIIVTYISNLGFEAMLYGRTPVVLSENMPWSFITTNNSKLLGEGGQSGDNYFINYMMFGYFVPIELAFDKDYILWRCNNPSIEEIYNKNIDFILKKRGLKKETLSLYQILKSYRGFSEENIKELENYNYYQEITDNINTLNNNLEDKELKLNSVINENRDLLESLNQVQEINIKLNETIEDLNKKYQDALCCIKNMENSKSWKLTIPLRIVSKALKK